MTDKTTSRNWQLAGLFDDDGSLDKPIAIEKIRVPSRIETYGDYLLWAEREIGEVWDEAKRNSNLLIDFIKLESASAFEIEAFARRYGVLGVCAHFLTSGFEPPHLEAFSPNLPLTENCSFERQKSSNNSALRKTTWHWEHLEIWKHLAGQARAFINLTANLMNNKAGLPEDWEMIFEWTGINEQVYINLEELGVGDVQGERQLITTYVNHWVKWSKVQPFLSCDTRGNRPKLIFGVDFGHSFLAARLAIELMLNVGRTNGLVSCSSCGNFYSPLKRRPKSSQRNYCPGCGRRAAMRDAAADHRARKKIKNAKGNRN